MTKHEAIEVLEEVKTIDDSMFAYNQAYNDALDIAIDALKAQEPIAPVKVNRYIDTDENGHWFSPETYDCGNCGVELHGKANYCHLCGRAVKWE